MQLGIKTYLTDIILRTLCPGIEKRRVSQRNQLNYLQLVAATSEELWAFI